MAGAYRRGKDRKRGKSGKYTIWWIDETGQKKTQAGPTDKAAAQAIARKLQSDALLVRNGLIDKDEVAQKEAAERPIREHVMDYAAHMEAAGDTHKHVIHARNAIFRMLADAGIDSVSSIAADRVLASFARLRAVRSARTANHALNSLRAFVRWLDDAGRIKEYPRGLRQIKKSPEKADRRRLRRAIGAEELNHLLAVAEAGRVKVTKRDGLNGPPIGRMDGRDRAMLYRLAMATGFRANELRNLTPESFRLDGDSPTIVCSSRFSKRGKRTGDDDVQMIRRDMAEVFREYIKDKPPGKPIMAVPRETATMLKADLAAAGIPYRDEKGRYLDFHALRASYITQLVNSGMNIKLVQTLARHSTIVLTMDVYHKVEDRELRAALEATAPKPPAGPPPADAAPRD